VVVYTHVVLTSASVIPHYPFDRKLGGNQNRSERYGEVPGLELGTLGRPANSRSVYRLCSRGSGITRDYEKSFCTLQFNTDPTPVQRDTIPIPPPPGWCAASAHTMGGRSAGTRWVVEMLSTKSPDSKSELTHVTLNLKPCESCSHWREPSIASRDLAPARAVKSENRFPPQVCYDGIST
jgi:hypothetical protein